VDLSKVTWVLSGDEHVAEYRPPPNVVPVTHGQDLSEMVATGELVAAVGLKVDHPDVAPLIPDPAEAAFTSLRERGLYPINHLVVVKDELLETHSDLAADVFSAFSEAKNRYVTRLREGTITEPTATDRTYQRVMDITGEDPLPYGIDPNRAMIEMLIDHAVMQRILDHRPQVDELFAEGTRDLVA
jgi:4,5-dihydroxyphthalate decarboxylase